VIRFHAGDNLEFLRGLPDQSVDFIYIDPPFNTGRDFGYNDSFASLPLFLEPRLRQMHRVVKDGIIVHLDHHESHYIKILLDQIFGRDNFRNEIIWAYDYGGRSKKFWPKKHDTLLWYSKTDFYTFNYDEMDRIPYMAPGLVGEEKAAIGKTPTDVWWHTILPTNSKERTGYPTQKPVSLIRRIIKIHTNPGDVVADFFAGSGTTGEAAAALGRTALLVDRSPQSAITIKKRFAGWTFTEI
jgi:site-specific DNA-methyltransferase (adenine-specific)